MRYLVIFCYRYICFPFFFLILQALTFMGVIKTNSKLARVVRLKNARNFIQYESFKTLSGPVLWFHAASGEIEYARPVLRELKKKYPSLRTLVTFTSPSVESQLASLPDIDCWGPAPWDTPLDLQSFLIKWQPRIALFSRTDAWPETIWQCELHHIPIILFAATFSAKSTRLRGISSLINKICFQTIHEIHCVSLADAENLRRAIPNLSASRIKISGDTRYDQVTARSNSPKPLPAPDKLTYIKQTLVEENVAHGILVLGSTWAEDEQQITPILRKLVDSGWKIIWAPHEVDPHTIEKIKSQLNTRGITWNLLSSPYPWKSEQVLLVDQIGHLADLYNLGQIAFVGGSFRKLVHSVMEPLAAGCPVLVGPFHQNNRETLEFKKIQLDNSEMTMVTVIKNGEDLFKFCCWWNRNENRILHEKWKVAIKYEVKQREGASQQIIQSVEKLLEKDTF